jgi:hypothetical protein
MDIRLGHRVGAAPVMFPGFRCGIGVVHGVRLSGLR